MKFSLSICSLILMAFVALPALASSNPFLAYAGTFEVAKSDVSPCEQAGCFFHIHIGDTLEINATDSTANVIADKMGLSLEMKEEHEDLGEGYTSDSGFSSKNGSAEYFSGTQVGGLSLKLKNQRDGLVEFHYLSTRGSFTESEVRLLLRKVK